jgi:23S rRNA pseudouridine1911/1915/1917 synthase
MTRRIVYEMKENYMTLSRPASCSEFLRARGFSRHLLTYLRHHENTLFLNGESVYTNHPVRKGDVLEVIFTDEISSERIVPNPMDLNIVYEDDDILVLDKPPFLPIQPSIGHYEYTLGNGVVAYYDRQGIPFVYRCVNRLDRNTSGLVIVAKNMASSAILYDEMKARRIRRTYFTVVHGRIDAAGTVDAPIRRRAASMIERCVDPENGQRAITHFAPLSYNPRNDTTALSVRLETGRTHQIRVHMAYLQHPVAGDTLYGWPEDVISRQALHSMSLEFMHPITREPVRFEAPVPEDIRSLL